MGKEHPSCIDSMVQESIRNELTDTLMEIIDAGTSDGIYDPAAIRDLVLKAIVPYQTQIINIAAENGPEPRVAPEYGPQMPQPTALPTVDAAHENLGEVVMAGEGQTA